MVIEKTQLLGCISKSLDSFEKKLVEKDSINSIILTSAKISRLEKEAAIIPSTIINNHINEKESVATPIAINDPSQSNILKQLVDDCVPCWDRLKKRNELNFSSSFNQSLKDALDRQLNLKTALKALADTSEIRELNNLCYYFDTLKGQCLPDIDRLIALFSLVLQQLLEQLTADISANLANLLIAIFRPFLLNLHKNLDQFIQLIIEPIECVKTSIFYQFDKIDSIITSKKAKELKHNLYSNTDKIIETLKEPSDTFNEAEKTLMEGITFCENWVKDKQLSITNLVSEVFSNSSSTKTVIQLNSALKLGLIIQILEILKEFIDKNGDFCKDDKNREKSLEKLFKEYINKTNNDSKLEIIKDNGKFLLKIRTQIKNPKQIPINQQNTDINILTTNPNSLSSESSIEPIFTIHELGCFDALNSSKINQVIDWISQIENDKG